MLCSLSDDLHKRSKLLRARASLQLCLKAGWNGSSDAQKQAHWQQHYRTFYASNSCGKEAKADEVLCLFEVRFSPVYSQALTLHNSLGSRFYSSLWNALGFNCHGQSSVPAVGVLLSQPWHPLQTWCLRECTGEVTAITSLQEVCDFMEYAVAVKSKTRWSQQTIAAVKTWTQRLAWYHGYISKEEWPEGDHSFMKHIRMDPDQASSRLAVGTRNSVTSSRHALEQHQMQQTYRFALTRVSKRQMLLHNVFANLTSQTTVRPNEMSYMVALDMSMSVRPHLKFGQVHLFELGGVGKAKVNAAVEKFAWVLRHPKVDIDDPVFWLAASLMEDDTRLAEDGHGSFIEMLATQRTGMPAFAPA